MRECMTTTATSTTQTRGNRGRPCCRRSTSSHARARLETGYRYYRYFAEEIYLMRMDSNIDFCRRVRTTGRATATWPGESRSCAATTASTGYRTASTRSADIFYWLPNIFVCNYVQFIYPEYLPVCSAYWGCIFIVFEV